MTFIINLKTITLIESRHPEKLLLHLKNAMGYKVEKTDVGIYTVLRDALPIQLIDSRRLSADENFWLKSLNKQLDPLTVLQIKFEVRRRDKAVRIQAYMNAITMANVHAIEEAMKMANEAQLLEDLMVRTGLAAKLEARGEERKALAIAQNMFDMGFPIESVVSATKLDSEKVKKLCRGMGSRE